MNVGPLLVLNLNFKLGVPSLFLLPARFNHIKMIVLPKCLFGVLDEESWQHHTRIFLRESLFFARKVIALRWMAHRPPSLTMWKILVNSVVPFNYLVYKR